MHRTSNSLGGYRIQNRQPYGVELSLLASVVLGGSSIPRAIRLRKPVPIFLALLSTFGIITFGCGDPKEFLIHTVENKCISVTGVVIPATYVHTALNAATDWIMALLPILTIWKLSMPRITKFWAYLLLGLGAAGSIVSLIRFGYVEGIRPGAHFFKQSAKFALYSIFEPGLGIAAVNFATLRPLFKTVLERTLPTFVTARYRTKDATDMSQRRQGRSHISYEDQKGFQLFDLSDSRTHTIIATTPRLDIINEYELSREDESYLNRSASQKSLVGQHTTSRPWAPHGSGVVMTRQVDISQV